MLHIEISSIIRYTRVTNRLSLTPKAPRMNSEDTVEAEKPSQGAQTMTAEPANPFHVFYSYAHKDEKLRDELGKYLHPMRREGLILDWCDRNISAGKDWEQEID